LASPYIIMKQVGNVGGGKGGGHMKPCRTFYEFFSWIWGGTWLSQVREVR
jgi:hypothetical protein